MKPTMTPSPAASNAPAAALEQRAWDCLRAGQSRAAIHCCEQLNRQYPHYAAGWYTSSQVALRLNNAHAALAAVEQLLRLQPQHPGGRLQQAHCLMRLGREAQARPLVLALDGEPLQSAYQHATLALLLSRLDLQERALEHYGHAVRLEPEVGEHYYNLATVQRFLGDVDAAERALDAALARNPDDAQAHKLRADLRRQTPERNHVAQLQQALLGAASPRQRVTLEFALAKELEDLERWEEAFAALRRGADGRRALMRYQVAEDVDTMATIAAVHDTAFLAAPGTGPSPGDAGARPIFVVGLPRTGTTLVERILGMHPAVQAAGELNHFARCLSQAVAALPAASPRISKQQRVALSAGLDPVALGQAYLDAARPAARGAAHFVDKMPLNFLYLGLIRRALPEARIVHLRRHPLDACYAIYKTLFADAYPFSYSLEELADYYLAYHRLMAHWDAVMPGVIHHVQYERLVTQLEPGCRALLAHCGLDWDARCLDFHRSREASTTASASQVREPVHRRSVGRWQHFARQLAPLAERLAAGGVAVD
jgi:tetratricopeptide (TPR) repeat protein